MWLAGLSRYGEQHQQLLLLLLLLFCLPLVVEEVVFSGAVVDLFALRAGGARAPATKEAGPPEETPPATPRHSPAAAAVSLKGKKARNTH